MLFRNATDRRRTFALLLCIGAPGLLLLFVLHSRPRAAYAPNRLGGGKIRGHTPWAILLCKFSDQPQEPHPVKFFRDMFTEEGAGTNNVFDYWKDISYGNITTAGSRVFGWFTMVHTLEEAKKLDRHRVTGTPLSRTSNNRL